MCLYACYGCVCPCGPCGPLSRSVGLRDPDPDCHSAAVGGGDASATWAAAVLSRAVPSHHVSLTLR